MHSRWAHPKREQEQEQEQEQERQPQPRRQPARIDRMERTPTASTEPDPARSDARSTTIPATPAQVWAAISDPARIARWWGPDGFTNTIHQFDFTEGGTWRLTMHGPDGSHYPNESRFTRIVPGELFEIEHLGEFHFWLSITLTAQDGATRVGWLQVFESPEQFAPMADFIAGANDQNLRRLAAEVAARASTSDDPCPARI
jgi:uncharacterized protein YndB with AHSA1/START domain